MTTEMTRNEQSFHASYSHELLLHHDDETLVGGTRLFVQRALEADGHVLVHSSRTRLGLLRDALGEDPRIEYAYDEDLYQAPTQTLFAYQRKLAEYPEATDAWVTGTVPLGDDIESQSAWARYESMVNAALATFPFHALCTYDTRALPASAIAAAKATHPTISSEAGSLASDAYACPAAFLHDPLARVPRAPDSAPDLVTTVTDLTELAHARRLVRTTARAHSAVSYTHVDDLVVAMNEVAANGLVHGAPPVRIVLWAELGRLTCRVVDAGPGGLDPLSGFRYPELEEPMGLWAARQQVDDLFIGTTERGGTSVLLFRT